MAINNVFESTTTKPYGMQCALCNALSWVWLACDLVQCFHSWGGYHPCQLLAVPVSPMGVCRFCMSLIFLHNSCMPVIPLLLLPENYPVHLSSQRQKFLLTTVICNHRWCCVAHNHLFILIMLVLLHWSNNSLISVSNKH